jgi:predicted DCC family thiol-disulfide oxidoreductase YuxK
VNATAVHCEHTLVQANMPEELTTEARAAPSAPVCVYFDGSCPICTAEIGVYRKAAEPTAVQFIDITQPNVALPAGATRDALLARFHVRDAQGQLISGARGFVALWLAIPRFRRLGRLAAWRPVTALLELGYRAFLRMRPLWRPRSGASSP